MKEKAALKTVTDLQDCADTYVMLAKNTSMTGAKIQVGESVVHVNLPERMLSSLLSRRWSLCEFGLMSWRWERRLFDGGRRLEGVVNRFGRRTVPTRFPESGCSNRIPGEEYGKCLLDFCCLEPRFFQIFFQAVVPAFVVRLARRLNGPVSRRRLRVPCRRAP